MGGRVGGRKAGAVTINQQPGGQRGRAWAVIRNVARRGRCFSCDELHILSQDRFGAATEDQSNLSRWLKRLSEVGVLEALSGCRGTPIQYRLARDLGPRRPILRNDGSVYDPNKGEVVKAHDGRREAAE